MKTPIAIVFLGGAALVGTLAGYILGPSSNQRSADPKLTTSPRAPFEGGNSATIGENESVMGGILSKLLDNDPGMNPEFFAALETLNLEQLREALRRAKGISKMGGIEAISSRIVMLDPAAGPSAFSEAPVGNTFKDTNGLVVAWARAFPDAAWAASQAYPESAKSKAVMSEVIRSIAKSDPRAALARLELFPDAEKREQARANCFRTWFRNSPDDATTWALNNIDAIPVGANKSTTLSIIVDEIASRDGNSAIALVEKLPSNVARGVQGELFRGLGRLNFQDAVSYAERKNIPIFGLESHYRSILSSGSKYHSKQVADWLTAKPAGFERDTLISYTIHESSKLTKQLFPLLSERVQPSFVPEFIKASFSDTPTEARGYAMGLPDGKLKIAALRAYAQHLNPPGILSDIEHTPEGDSRDALRAGYVSQLGIQEPARAAEELQKIANFGMRKAAAESIKTAWMRTDYASADAWFKKNAGLFREPR